MRRVLLIADLEGIAGVDAVEALIAGSPSYPRACELLTAELNSAIEGLVAAGAQAVRVSDSHQSGSGETNVLRGVLHPAAELIFGEDAYSPELFEGVEAIACLGMHAPAGTDGFAAHTIDLLGMWECAGRRLSETDLVLAMAAEAGVPAVFISGDDVLESSLGGRVAFLRTKRSLSRTRSESLPVEEVREALRRAALLPPRAVEPIASAPIVLTFKSGRQTELAARTGLGQLDRYRVAVSGGSFRERYQRGLRAASAAGAVLGEALRGSPGQPEFTEDVTGLMALPASVSGGRRSYADAAHAALRAFLALTDGPSEQSRALRALTLHMLEAHAPGLFVRWELGATLESAVAALAALPLRFPPELDPDDGQARLDALYVRHARGLPHAELDAREFTKYQQHLDEQGSGVYAWLLGELAASCGIDARLSVPERPFREQVRLADLYWLTHLYLLDTRYLRAPLQDLRVVAWTEELLVATPSVVSERRFDLAAEVAFCLQVAGEAEGGAHAMLLEALAAAQRPDGSVLDETLDEAAEGAGDHTTAAALLAFAGAEERAPD